MHYNIDLNYEMVFSLQPKYKIYLQFLYIFGINLLSRKFSLRQEMNNNRFKECVLYINKTRDQIHANLRVLMKFVIIWYVKIILRKLILNRAVQYIKCLFIFFNIGLSEVLVITQVRIIFLLQNYERHQSTQCVINRKKKNLRQRQ